MHPGETGASWMMKGVLDYLLGYSENAQVLRSNYIFKLVPMLNPDGVINGNTRCNLSGVDLNRHWLEPSPKLHPTAYHYKEMVRSMKKERDVFLVLDLHGHSRNKNIFCYGNKKSKEVNAQERGPVHLKGVKEALGFHEEYIFPALLDENADLFNFGNCAFSVKKAKESTMRVVMWKELDITNSYTCEASFCGPD